MSAPAVQTEVPEDLRATVTVSREHPKDVGQRQVIVQIDGGRKVKLLFGEWLTEVNVTSPTGIQEINALDGVRLEAKVIDFVVRRAGELTRSGRTG